MNIDFSSKYPFDEKNLKNSFNLIWEKAIKNLGTISKPQAYVLGGQPGAGKSIMTNQILKNELFKNAIVISGDDYRRYHPKYEYIQKKEKLLSAKYTQAFSSKITEMLIEKASCEKYNVIIEGTFRTATTPLQTLEKLKARGYETHVAIIATPAKISRTSCLERYKKQFITNPYTARFTNPADHDVVIQNLSKNVNEVFLTGKADFISLYTRDKILEHNIKFSNESAIEVSQRISSQIDNILDLSSYEKAKGIISFKEKQEIKELEKLQIKEYKDIYK